MPRDGYDVVIVGGGSAGCALANRLSADPSTRVLVLEAGRQRLPVGRVHPHARRADVPQRQPVLRLALRVRAGAAHGRQADRARPGQGARRLQQHQRDDLPAGQPAGLRAVGGRPRDGHLGLRPLPALLHAHGELPGRRARTTSSAGTAGRSCSNAGPPRNPLFGAFLQAVQEAGYPLTDDVNGYRQEGFARFDRNVHRGRRLSAARAYLHPVMSRPNLDVRTGALVTKVAFDGTRAVGVEYSHWGRPVRRVDAGEVVLCGGAINTPQLLQLSGVGEPGAAARAGHPRRRRPARRRREPPGPPGGLRAARVHAAGVDAALPGQTALARHRCTVALPAQRPRRHQPLRGGRLRPQQRRRRLPEPDVPLPADRGALRRHADRGRTRLPGAHRPDVLRRPRHLHDHQHGPAHAPRPAVQLPVHRPGPPGVGRGAPA